MRRRVVITGIGAVTPVGNDVAAVWESVKRGASGIGPITHFDASSFPTTFAAEVKGFDFSAVVDDPAPFKAAGRNVRFAVGAATQAMTESGLLDGPHAPAPDRFGVYLGAGEGQQNFHVFMQMLADAGASPGGELDLAEFTKLGMERLDAKEELEQEPNMPSAHLAALFDARGPNLNCLTACAASSQAIGEATEIIRRGDADVMLSGGAHSMIHPFGLTGFNLLTSLSTRNGDPQAASRPFDADRDGFVLGEGAGMLVLEEHDRAVKRGANIVGEVLGYGSSCDAYRITDIHPEGRGAVACITGALNDAGIDASQVDYVNAHGTSTQVNDRTETAAIKQALNGTAAKTPVSSTKSMMGHLIAAAGSVEAILCLLAIRDGVLPPTINYETPDPNCDLDYVPNAARDARVERTLSNSFGFGGQNVSLILGRYVG